MSAALRAGSYSGDNPPDGALDHRTICPRGARLDRGARRRAARCVRCFDAPGDAGVQRTSWDLTETPPVPWLRARDWNRGGPGADRRPGTLHRRAACRRRERLDQPLDVEPDPRAAWTQAQICSRATDS